MMKKFKIAIQLVLLMFLGSVSGQVDDTAQSKYSSTAPETIYVHHNGSLFFTGEYLFYKLYCMNSENNKLSRLSKVAYVELIGQDQEVVFRHKVSLDKGIGNSDFFIPNTTPSGNYKLVAYTHWMKNDGIDRYFQSDISIVNPYRGNQLPILNDDSEEIPTTSKPNSEIINPIRSESTTGFSKFKLSLDAKTYSKRKKVQLTIKNNIRENGFGNYSISVKKIDELPAVTNHTGLGYMARSVMNKKQSAGALQYLPEVNGALLTGTVYDIQTTQVAAGKDVAISVAGDDFFFKVATTNALGEFSFAMDSYVPKDDAFIQMIDVKRENYRIEVDPFEPSQYNNLTFAGFKISASMEDVIKQRSTYNQIENGYFGIKPDTIGPLPVEKAFTKYEKFTRFNLDDYTRFPTMEEVFQEIVGAVWTARGEAGKRVVKVFNNDFSAPSNDPPLLFIDGAFVADPNDFLAYDALKIQQISVLRNKYKFGSQDYQGVILVETILGDYKPQNQNNFAKELPLFLTQNKKQYFVQEYSDGSTSSRIPDFRSQLLWEPSISVASSNQNFTFYTSDNTGKYEVVLEGFTKDGTPISLREIFTVNE